MKLLKEITLSDLEKHPIWRHETDSDDVETITQVDDFDSPDTCGYIARTQFDTAGGKTFFGFCSPQDPSGLDYVQPVILAGLNYVELWDEKAGADSNPFQVAQALGLDVVEVFPLHYRCLVPFEGEHWEDIVDIAT